MTSRHRAFRDGTKRFGGYAAALLGSLLSFAATWPAPAAAGVVECAARRSAVVMVRIGSNPAPARLQLSGGASPALQLVDPQSGAVRWSAAAAAPASQIFPGMWAGFAGSLAVVDLDGDGLHERVYAGDLAGRLWRFDIHQGAQPEALFTGGIFAALGGAPVVRAFLAPPDVSLSPAGGDTSWLNIAIGSASLAPGPQRNRFYVLRDHAAFEVWSAEDYGRWHPVTETDLTWTNDPAHAGEALPDSGAGFYVTLEGGSVVLPSITVAGRTAIAVTEDLAGVGAQCAMAVTVSSLSLADGQLDVGAGKVEGDHNPMKRALRVPVTATFSITAEAGASEATCRLGEAVIQGCAVSTRLVPLWWRREDAD